MTSKNSTILLLFLFIYTLVQFSTQISAQTPIFACDTVKDPSLSNVKFCDSSAGVAERVNDLIIRLTLEEKIGFLVNTGKIVEMWGIPSYEWWNEALHGVGGNGSWGTHFNNLIPAATSFPQVILTAASFNVTLFEAIGKVVSTEARAMYNYGLSGLTVFAPNINIFRDPRWGRGQETPGEDPLLTSAYATAYVRGLQERGDNDPEKLKVAACCKHFNAYDLDHWNNIVRTKFNAEVTKQDLEDTFKPPFKSCIVDGKAASIMCSYNQVNGKPSCADPDLAKVVRGEWNLNGYIVSDYDAIAESYFSQHYTKTPEEAAALALIAGVDLNVGNFLLNYTEKAIKAGLVDEADVDNAISNNLATLMRLGFFDGDPRKQLYGELGPSDVCTYEHKELAREAARQGIVLLKNLNNTLPLSPIRKLAILGPHVDATGAMLGNYAGNACEFITPMDGIGDLIIDVGGVVESGSYSIDLGMSIAASTDATILIMGNDISYEQEDHDRVSLTLPSQQQDFITDVAKASKGPTILVLMSGGGLDIQFAKDDPNIKGILWVGYPGEAGGAAMGDVIFGFHNPSGKLPMSWYPQSYTNDIPMTNMNMRPDPSTRYPGRTYRFHTGPTVFDFGYGLSYSKFTYEFVESAPKLISIPLLKNHISGSKNRVSLYIESVGRCPLYDIGVRVRNEGGMDGAETVMLFSSPPKVHGAPRKQLLAFEKVFIEKGKIREVTFKVDACKVFSVVDEFGRRRIPLGNHVFDVGSLSFNVNVTAAI